MRYWGLTLLGLAIAGAAVVGIDWGLFHVVRTGTCASGGPYVSARPCPPGTGLHILALTGGVFGGLLGILVYGVRGPGGRPSPRIGLGVILWSLLFITIAGSILLAAFGPAAKGSPGGHLVAIILAAIFVPLGLAPWVTGFGRGGSISAPAAPGFVPRGSPPPVGGPDDPLDKIAKLGQLRDRGLVSPEEFEEQKRRLLGEL